MRKNSFGWAVYFIIATGSLLALCVLVDKSYDINANKLPSLLVSENERRYIDDTKGQEGCLTYGPYVLLSPGDYQISIYYKTDTSTNKFDLFSGTCPVPAIGGMLPDDQREVTTQFHADREILDFEVRTFYSGHGSLEIEKIRICQLSSRNELIKWGGLAVISVTVIVGLVDIWLHRMRRKYAMAKVANNTFNIDIAWLFATIVISLFLPYFLFPYLHRGDTIVILICTFVVISYIVRLFLSTRVIFQFPVEKQVVVAILLLGTAMAIIVPPLRVTDETSHYIRAYSISEGNLIERPDGAEVAIQFQDFIDIAGDWRSHVWEEGYTYDVEKLNIAQKLRITGETVQIPLGPQASATSYNAINYIPHIIAILICKTFHRSIYLSIILGRLLNLLPYAFFSYFSVKRTPVCKTSFAIFLINPMLLHQVAAFSGDSLVVATTAYMIAFCLDIKFCNHRITNRENLLLAGLILILALCKPPYVLVSFIIFLIPKQCFGCIFSNKRAWIPYILYPVAGILIMILWMKFGAINVPEVETSHYTIVDVLNQPIKIACLMLFNFLRYVPDWIVQATCGIFGGGIYPAEVLKVIPTFIMLSFILDHSAYCLTYKDRIVLVATGMVILGSLLVVGFTWSEVGSVYFYGLQGRYFLPVIIIGCVGVLSNRAVQTHVVAFENKMLAAQFVMSCLTLLSVCGPYYG